MFRNIGSTFGIAIATLLLNSIPDREQAFRVVFLAPVLILLIAIPAVFIMPASPNVSPLKKRPAPTPAKA